LGHQLGATGDREHADRDVDYLQRADVGRNRDQTNFSDIGRRGRREPHGLVRLWVSFLLDNNNITLKPAIRWVALLIKAVCALGFSQMHELREPFLVCLLLSVFLLHCSVIGFALSTLLKPWDLIESVKNNMYLKWFFALSSGIIINITALFLIGISGYLNKYMVSLISVMLIIPSFFIIFVHLQLANQTASFYNQIIRITVSCRMFDMVSMVAIFVILIFIAIFRTPGYWDDTMYHLPISRFYVENQGIVLNEYLRFPLVPQDMQMLFVLGLMIGGDAVAQAIATIPVFIMSLGLIGCGLWLLGSTLPGFLSVLLLLHLPVIRETLGYAYIDDALALFSWGATLALALWASAGARSRRALVIAGMLAGGAAGTKIFGGVLALLLGLYLLLVRRDWGASLTYAIATVAFGSWWYVRSAILSGDPIHPVGGNIFGYFLWNAADLLNQEQTHGSYVVKKNLLYLWPAFQKAGALIWGLTFLSGIYAKRQNTGIKIFYGVFVIHFLLWFLVTRVERYLAPVVAVASFLSAYFLYRAALGRLLVLLKSTRAWLGNPHLPAALSLVVLLPAAAYLYMKVEYAITKRSEMLQKRTGYALFEQANQLSPFFGRRLVQVGFENDIYFFDGTVIGDWFGLARYSTMMTCSINFAHSADFCQMIPPLELIKLMKGFNSRMLVVNTKRVTIDVMVYKKYFELSKETEDGVLLTLR